MNAKIADFIALTKPRILGLVVFTTAAGYAAASSAEFLSWNLLVCLFGTALSCAGASALNNYLERDYDQLMERTKHRPLPARRVLPQQALAFGLLLVLGGTTVLVSQVNTLTGFLALLTAFLYVLVYTPLKRVTWLNTTIGAIPGALPPMGGWAAASDNLDIGAWILFLILFVWQHPHFYSIAWLCREDYRQSGCKMLPNVERSGGQETFRHIFIHTLLLIPVSLLPVFTGMAAELYFAAALFLGGIFAFYSFALLRDASEWGARRLFRVSIVYLPLLLILLVGNTSL